MLPYDILVIATGAVYPEGSAANLLKASAEATTAANRVKELRDLGELLFPKMRIFLHRFSKRNNGKHVAFDVHSGPRCGIIFYIFSFFFFSPTSACKQHVHLPHDATRAKDEDRRKRKRQGTRTKQRRGRSLFFTGAQVASSKGVMVVGAGLSGLEVAGEIATAHPNVPVKLISSKSALGDGMPPAIGGAHRLKETNELKAQHLKITQPQAQPNQAPSRCYWIHPRNHPTTFHSLAPPSARALPHTMLHVSLPTLLPRRFWAFEGTKLRRKNVTC